MRARWVPRLGGLLDWTMTAEGQRLRARVLLGGRVSRREFRRMLVLTWPVRPDR